MLTLDEMTLKINLIKKIYKGGWGKRGEWEHVLTIKIKKKYIFH